MILEGQGSEVLVFGWGINDPLVGYHSNGLRWVPVRVRSFPSDPRRSFAGRAWGSPETGFFVTATDADTAASTVARVLLLPEP